MITKAIICDGHDGECWEKAVVPYEFAQHVHRFRRELQGRGWLYLEAGGIDLCPKCRERRDRESKRKRAAARVTRENREFWQKDAT